jgi:hypothetical protein
MWKIIGCGLAREFCRAVESGSRGLLLKFTLLFARLFFELFLPSGSFFLKFAEAASRPTRHTSSQV